MPAGVLADPLDAHAPGHVPRPGAGDREPGRARSRAASPRSARRSPRAGPTSSGGAYAEVDEPLLPLESILWQFRTRRRGLSRAPRRPQRRDPRPAPVRALPAAAADRQAVRIPVRRPPRLRRRPVPDPPRGEAALGEPRRHEPGEPDAPSARAPTGPRKGCMLPWRLGAVDEGRPRRHARRWSTGRAPVAAWYRDLRRVAAYSPVLARWVTLNDYFHLTDRPFETLPARARRVRDALPGPGRRPATTRADLAARRCTRGSGRGSTPSRAVRAMAEAAAARPRRSPDGSRSLAEIEDGDRDRAARRGARARCDRQEPRLGRSAGAGDRRGRRRAAGRATW